MRMNSIAAYYAAGKRLAIAANKKDEGTIQHERRWFASALHLEIESIEESRTAFELGYAENRVKLKVEYFR